MASPSARRSAIKGARYLHEYHDEALALLTAIQSLPPGTCEAYEAERIRCIEWQIDAQARADALPRDDESEDSDE